MAFSGLVQRAAEFDPWCFVECSISFGVAIALWDAELEAKKYYWILLFFLLVRTHIMTTLAVAAEFKRLTGLNLLYYYLSSCNDGRVTAAQPVIDFRYL